MPLPTISIHWYWWRTMCMLYSQYTIRRMGFSTPGADWKRYYEYYFCKSFYLVKTSSTIIIVPVCHRIMPGILVYYRFLRYVNITALNDASLIHDTKKWCKWLNYAIVYTKCQKSCKTKRTTHDRTLPRHITMKRVSLQSKASSDKIHGLISWWCFTRFKY